jgi:hypothetical protein
MFPADRIGLRPDPTSSLIRLVRVRNTIESDTRRKMPRNGTGDGGPLFVLPFRGSSEGGVARFGSLLS